MITFINFEVGFILNFFADSLVLSVVKSDKYASANLSANQAYYAR